MKVLKLLKYSALAASFTAASFVATPALADFQCEDELTEIYENIDTTGFTSRKVDYITIFAVSAPGSVDGYEAWYSFNECKGNLVIQVDQGCGFPHVYSTGNCTIKDIPNF